MEKRGPERSQDRNRRVLVSVVGQEEEGDEVSL